MNMPGQRSFLVSASVVLVLAGCGAGTERASTPLGVASASAAVSASLPGASRSSSAAPPSSAPSLETEIVCEPTSTNACVGSLSAGRHTSRLFQPAISFDVPDGWSNHEDEARGYVMYAPGSIPPDSEFGARDKIAILPDVASTPKGCGAPGPDRGESAQDIAHWMAGRENLDVTAPAPVSVGGLDGSVVDVRLDPAATIECFPMPGVMLFHGLGPSEGVEEGIVAGTVMRLYFLDHGDDVVAIEVADVSGGRRIDDFAAVATSVQFERTPSAVPTNAVGSRQLVIMVNNLTKAPVDLFVAEDGSPMGQEVGTAVPKTIPAMSGRQVIFTVPSGERWAIFVDPDSDDDGLISARDVPPSASGALPFTIWIDEGVEPIVVDPSGGRLFSR